MRIIIESGPEGNLAIETGEQQPQQQRGAPEVVDIGPPSDELLSALSSEEVSPEVEQESSEATFMEEPGAYPYH